MTDACRIGESISDLVDFCTLREFIWGGRMFTMFWDWNLHSRKKICSGKWKFNWFSLSHFKVSKLRYFPSTAFFSLNHMKMLKNCKFIKIINRVREEAFRCLLSKNSNLFIGFFFLLVMNFVQAMHKRSRSKKKRCK